MTLKSKYSKTITTNNVVKELGIAKHNILTAIIRLRTSMPERCPVVFDKLI